MSDRQQFEDAIRSYSLTFPYVFDPYVESLLFPPMMKIYMAMVESDPLGLPPTQAEFSSAICAELSHRNLNVAAVIARACRTYSACVQQHHFLLLLQERFENVWWDAELDMHHGIDVVVMERGWRFGFSVSVQTERADHYKARKARYYDQPPFPVLDVKVQPNEYTCGRFWLVSPGQVDEVQAFIDMHLVNGAA